jgi:hypothetical protein
LHYAFFSFAFRWFAPSARKLVPAQVLMTSASASPKTSPAGDCCSCYPLNVGFCALLNLLLQCHRRRKLWQCCCCCSTNHICHSIVFRCLRAPYSSPFVAFLLQHSLA